MDAWASTTQTSSHKNFRSHSKASMTMEPNELSLEASADMRDTIKSYKNFMPPTANHKAPRPPIAGGQGMGDLSRKKLSPIRPISASNRKGKKSKQRDDDSLEGKKKLKENTLHPSLAFLKTTQLKGQLSHH